MRRMRATQRKRRAAAASRQVAAREVAPGSRSAWPSSGSPGGGALAAEPVLAHRAERIRELGEEACRRLLADADLDGRAARRIEVRAEQDVPQHQVLAVVLVALLDARRVVPAVQARRVEHVVERTE